MVSAYRGSQRQESVLKMKHGHILLWTAAACCRLPVHGLLWMIGFVEVFRLAGRRTPVNALRLVCRKTGAIGMPPVSVSRNQFLRGSLNEATRLTPVPAAPIVPRGKSLFSHETPSDLH
jgi:hypothetical protein